MKRLLPAILIAAACAGTGADDDDLVERVDSAGVTLIRNHAPERPLDWSFEPVLTIGGVDEGPEAFAGLGAESVATDAAGRIYVADGGNYRVKVFDTDGELMREMGSEGGGPGEFAFVGAFDAGPDGTAFVVDFSKRGLVGFDSAGVILPLRVMDGFPGSRLRVLENAFAVVTTPMRESPEDTTRARLRIHHGVDSTVIATEPDMAPAEFVQLPNCPISLRVPPLLSPRLIWDARGDRLALTGDASYSLAFWERDPAGRWRLARRVSRELAPIAATVEIAAAEYPDSFRIRAGSTRCSIAPVEVAEALGFADTAPHVKDIALAPDGTLWVLHRTADDDVTRIDVFAPDGAYLGTLPADAPFPAAFRGSDEIVSVERDDLDRPIVVVQRIHWH